MIEFLQNNLVIALFTILGLGALVGRIRVLGVELGNVSGVLFVGLLLGHFGLEETTPGYNIGFTLFIFCIGYQAGPQFLNAFRVDGLRYTFLAVLTAAIATSLSIWLAIQLEFEEGVAAGVLAGGLTSTPSLVAAQDALRELGSGSQALDNLASAYAITYVFGMAGLVMFIALVPRLMRIDLAEEAQDYASGQSASTGAADYRMFGLAERPSVRAYVVENPEFVERFPAKQDYSLAADIQRVKRGNAVFVPDEDYLPALGDLVSVVALQPVHQELRKTVGPEILDYDVLDRSVESRNILVASHHKHGETLKDLDLPRRYQAYLTQVTRGGVNLPRRPDLQLEVGDQLLVSGSPAALDKLASDVGYSEKKLDETDIAYIAMGIAAGVFFGGLSVDIGGIRLSLGSAGGTLIAGLICGISYSRRPNIGHFPAAARNILMELGLMLFMAGIAVNAGGEIVDTLARKGFTLLLCGAAVTLIPAIAVLLLGRFVMGMNGALLLGAVTGSMTSTPALTQVNKLAGNNTPMLGYVGTYTFANVLLAVAGAIVARLL